jgi:glycosyltransferase involved in cell wall biosynthesis
VAPRKGWSCRLITVVIATCGRPHLLQRTLQSLSLCARPSSFDGVLVVENGERSGAETVCQQKFNDLPVRYQWSPVRGKNASLNLAIDTLTDDSLVLLADDDLRFAENYLVAYASAAINHPKDHFFGGPFEAEYEVLPPQWLRKYLPLSALGWEFKARSFDNRNSWFLGFNWGAYVGDIRRVGGFDPRIGPGSDSNSTGDEVKIQKSMYKIGMRSMLVKDALVWHHVPATHCSEDWALDRAVRNGKARGEYVRECGGLKLITGHVQNGVRLVSSTTKLFLFGSGHRSYSQFSAHYRRNKAIGYFSAFGNSNSGKRAA